MMKSVNKAKAPHHARTQPSAEAVVMVDGIPFTPGMLAAFEHFKPSADVEPASREQLLAMLVNN